MIEKLIMKVAGPLIRKIPGGWISATALILLAADATAIQLGYIDADLGRSIQRWVEVGLGVGLVKHKMTQG